ncbi:MAG: phosphoglycerate kinase [Candidatus Cloacimonetes bacterium]|jgi:phosphoglycerate kinase|nr:phosphoglycerate kinase [Candidatus Cloacimonadota bacterium]MDD4231795.1 phosphoglycerate kinase [Candidatus Cloacimonadota bacterium]MDY0299510.1 phosphoglycerate kinase [Candidatus Cloacimonadaceae bacterium]
MSYIPGMMDADFRGKIVLVRMDHNVVKKGRIKDPMRIDATIPTLLHIFKKGGMPILMSHVGRPYDKLTKKISISELESVDAIVDYLGQKLQLKGFVPKMPATDSYGISDLNPLAEGVSLLKKGACDFVYLPNTRWFKGEEAKDESADNFAKALAAFADVYINDAFGSWQAHASTYHITKYLPSYAGLLMQKEIDSLEKVFKPKRPLVAVVAGSKFDTKIGPLSALIQNADHLVLGGVIYNAYLAAKYGINISGINEADVSAAKQFIRDSGESIRKVVELPYVVLCSSIDERTEDNWDVYNIKDLAEWDQSEAIGYILDAAPESFAQEEIKKVFAGAGTVFVNAVMGYTALFAEGSMAMYRLIDENSLARKLFGGGDTIQDFGTYLPGMFAQAQRNASYYFFTGGGAILSAIESGSAMGMKPVQALIQE